MTVGDTVCTMTVYDAYTEYDCDGAVGNSIQACTPSGQSYRVSFCGIETFGVSDFEDYSADLCRKAVLEAGLTIADPNSNTAFEGPWGKKGCFAYRSTDPNYPNTAWYGTGGTIE